MEYKNLITQSFICSEDFLEHFNLSSVTIKQLVDAFKYKCCSFISTRNHCDAKVKRQDLFNIFQAFTTNNVLI